MDCSENLYATNDEGLYVGKDGESDEFMTDLSCCFCDRDVSKKRAEKISGSFKRIKALKKKMLLEKEELLRLGREITLGKSYSDDDDDDDDDEEEGLEASKKTQKTKRKSDENEGVVGDVTKRAKSSDN